MDNNESRTETKILEAAFNIFILFGYHGTTLQKIAKKAGVNKSAIHYYFRSKDRIYIKIVKKVLVDILSETIISNNKKFEQHKLFLITELHTNRKLFIIALKELFLHDWEKKLIDIKEWLS
ncbi:MAG: helix-turn-helix domain containing protein [Bacteroidales bacterium]|nr:helix-turn-helix domain containing protein [Bacteroidales bacterium]